MQSINLFCEGILPMPSDKIINFEKYKQPDGFIYFYISEHEAFGAWDYSVKQKEEKLKFF